MNTVMRVGATDEARTRDALEPIVDACLKRMLTWRVPRNWSRVDWGPEITETAWAAALQAVHTLDAAPGIHSEIFIHNKIMADGLKRFRQEWAFSRQFLSHHDQSRLGEDDRPATGHVAAVASASPAEAIPAVGAMLDVVDTLPNERKWLLDQLYWQGSTEAEIAAILGHQPKSREQAQVGGPAGFARCFGPNPGDAPSIPRALRKNF